MAEVSMQPGAKVPGHTLWWGLVYCEEYGDWRGEVWDELGREVYSTPPLPTKNLVEHDILRQCTQQLSLFEGP